MKKRPTTGHARTARAKRKFALMLAVGWVGMQAWAWVAEAQESASPSTPPTVTSDGPQATTRPVVQTGATAIREDGPAYKVTGFEISYAQQRDGLPALADVMQTEVELGLTDSGFVAPRPGLETVKFKLADAPNQVTDQYHQSALIAIDTHIVKLFNRKGLIGIYVAQDAKDIDPDTGRDLRPADEKTMHITVLVGVVKELRTIAQGDRFPVGQRLNNPAHRKIIENSPVKPESMGGTGGKDLLRRNQLDDYVLRLNRNPSRQVDVSMAAAEESGGVALDYLVSETKPWSAYVQVSNTGTEQTDEWRERVGFIHNDLTRNNDVFNIDFITAGLDESNAVLASYDFPLFKADNLRMKVYGAWSEYTASELGIQSFEFEGEEWSLGVELSTTILQAKELFLDAVIGVRYKHVETDNVTGAVAGEADLWLPYVGLRLERVTEQSAINGRATLIFGDITDFETTDTGTGTSRESLDGLGRLETDEDFEVLQLEGSYSVFLEPLFNKNFKTLAHEIFFSGRAQFAFGNRLIPQETDVAGGLFTVRGYPETVSSGDTVYMGTAEYRFHLPRAFRVQQDPTKTPLFGKPFRYSPQQPYGRPDWDLVFKAFVDAAKVKQSDRLNFETDDTLVGVGVGLEFSFKQNINMRLEYGIATEEIEDEVDSGDSRLHFLITFLY